MNFTIRSFSAVRQVEIEEYLENQEYEKAIEVLKESKELDKACAGLVSDYSRLLIAVYRKTGKNADYRKELDYQIFSCYQRDLPFVKKLKENELLESEGLWDCLLKEVTEAGSIYLLDRYEKVLKKRYPGEACEVYIIYINELAKHVSDRKRYKELVQYLKKIAKYPEGQEKAGHIAEEWKALYKRRPAMMDELKKGGF